MSENLKNLYYTNLYLKEHLNPKMIKNSKINHYEFLIEEDYKKRYSKNYELLSKFGKVDMNDPDQIFMTDVTANIYLVESSPIIITSKY